ncbi:DUF4160 domain-containing protein [Flavisolibacter ginsenosidimutans]|uniref:DUF4160 domain-containing protein n=1 Tax=Flavisolibacter ginsenosidimutans TaxID=661481 RepID=A0A5B8UGY0_9BACT|nr:DUF4160 domain-containing protein [Flavisolibacter ginsenosidimutans]QEC55763.1 DUF4160 domain-containing protein [Flavisolibacter ginsenosidimutans]
MPTVLLLNGFRFFFYSRENKEPAHIHVAKGDAEGKIWLEPILEIAYFIRFTNSEQKQIIEIVTAHQQQFKNHWNEYFNQ